MITWSLSKCKYLPYNGNRQYIVECEFYTVDVVELGFCQSGVYTPSMRDSPNIYDESTQKEFDYMCKIVQAIWLMVSSDEEIRKSEIISSGVNNRIV